MCGRFCLLKDPVALLRAFALEWPEAFRKLLELFPTQNIPAVLADPQTGKPGVQFLHWGLVPHWAQDARSSARLINARTETAAQKPSFRDAYRRRRCLIPASGYWEWEKTPEGTIKHYFQPSEEGGHFVFAGLWERWQPDPQLPPLLSATILTTGAQGPVSLIHDRMPVHLSPEEWAGWLFPPGIRRPHVPDAI